MRAPQSFRLTAVLVALLLGHSAAVAADTQDCHIGSYRLADGGVVDVAPSDGNTLRWRTWSGETGQLHPQKDGSWTSTYGWTNRPDGRVIAFSDCALGEISFGKLSGKRIVFDVSNTTFAADDGVRLKGRLVMPQGTGKVPVVVLVHGSEHDSALDFYALQRMFPAEGIGAFVYDKRGTGISGGIYTQDFDVLAKDAVAAMKEARRLAGARAGRVGYQGGSEGGWVVPLAAHRAAVDFAVISFGLAVTVLDEDQESVALDMYFHHHSAEDTKKALELAAAGERVIETGGRQGYDAFDALRRKYKSEPWYKDVHGDFVWFVMPVEGKAKIDELAKQFDFHTPFHYQPMPTLRASTTPQLWVLGSDDLDAPSAETAARIKSLIADGKEYTLAVYPGAEHGMTEYELDAKGQRLSTRYAPGYFDMMADFIRSGRIGAEYGNAEITQPRSR
ncbi:MAG: alpha/beta hydrolase [Gammaproteobacteria bacterium]|nr:alpha/beta hydrolase [Gammaproteobacteria bacterium]